MSVSRSWSTSCCTSDAVNVLATLPVRKGVVDAIDCRHHPPKIMTSAVPSSMTAAATPRSPFLFAAPPTAACWSEPLECRQRAGVSVGLVQHYYGSKEELLVDTLERVLADALARVDRATTDAEQRHSRIEHMLANGLEQLLPLDEVRREETCLTVVREPRPTPQLRARSAGFRPARGLAAERVVCGEVPDSALTDPDLEGLALLALVDGLAGDSLAPTLASPGSSAGVH